MFKSVYCIAKRINDGWDVSCPQFKLEIRLETPDLDNRYIYNFLLEVKSQNHKYYPLGVEMIFNILSQKLLSWFSGDVVVFKVVVDFP